MLIFNPKNANNKFSDWNKLSFKNDGDFVF